MAGNANGQVPEVALKSETQGAIICDVENDLENRNEGDSQEDEKSKAETVESVFYGPTSFSATTRGKNTYLPEPHIIRRKANEDGTACRALSLIVAHCRPFQLSLE